MSTLLSTDMILERSSTRLHAPPGGKSSISFGGYEPEEMPKRKAQPPPASSIFMQTEENVRNAPASHQGSTHGNIFGGDAAQPYVKKHNPTITSANIFPADPAPRVVERSANNIFPDATEPVVQRTQETGGMDHPAYIPSPRSRRGPPPGSDHIFSQEANLAEDAAANAQARYERGMHTGNNIFHSNETAPVMRQVAANNIFPEANEPAHGRVHAHSSMQHPEYAYTRGQAPASRDNIFSQESNLANDAANNAARRGSRQERSTDLFSTMSQQRAPASRARQAPGGTSSISLG